MGMHVLKSAFIELTKHCNLNCVHCYVVDNTHRNELTTDEVQRLLRELSEERFLMLTLSGGEVLLRRDFFEIAAYAKSLRFAMTIFTNGTLITDAVADQFAALRPHKVEISLHGVMPETCDAVTEVAGSYARIVAGIRRLRARGVQVVLKGNTLDLNVHEVAQAHRLAQQLGVWFRAFDPTLVPRFSGDLQSVAQMASGEAIQTLIADSLRPLSAPELQAALEHPCRGANSAPCGIGAESAVTIGADGYLYPCPLWRFHGFNLRKIPFREAYHRKAELIPEVIHARNSDLERCPDCDATGHYHHCFATAMRTTGDPLAHIPAHHRIAQATARAFEQVQARKRTADGPDAEPAVSSSSQITAANR